MLGTVALLVRFASTSSGSSDVVRARPTEVTFTLPCQVVVSARISADYPKPTSSVTITELACVGWPTPARESMDLPALQVQLHVPLHSGIVCRGANAQCRAWVCRQGLTTLTSRHF